MTKCKNGEFVRKNYICSVCHFCSLYPASIRRHIRLKHAGVGHVINRKENVHDISACSRGNDQPITVRNVIPGQQDLSIRTPGTPASNRVIQTDQNDLSMRRRGTPTSNRNSTPSASLVSKDQTDRINNSHSALDNNSYSNDMLPLENFASNTPLQDRETSEHRPEISSAHLTPPPATSTPYNRSTENVMSPFVGQNFSSSRSSQNRSTENNKSPFIGQTITRIRPIQNRSIELASFKARSNQLYN